MSLPAAYQKVEYIQSSGTQYFTVGNQFKTSYKIVIDFQMTQIGGDYIPIGIHYNDGGSNNIKYGLDAYNGYFMVNAGGNWTNTKTEDTNRHIITIDKSAVKVDGESYTTNYVNYTYSQGIGVFCYWQYHQNPPEDFLSSNKLYKLDIYDENGNHIHDLVPCYRKSDSVIGMYDLINNTFYTNAGTGTFTKGPNVNSAEHEMVNAYIGQGLIDFSYSYDFTNKSISTLQNDGYTLSNTGVQFGSNGVRTNNSTSWVDINTAEASFGVELTADSVYHAVLNGYWDGYSVPQVNFGGGCSFFFGMGGNTNTWRFYINGTNYTNTGSSTVAARKIDATVDLKNGTAEIKFYVGSTLTSTISRTLTTAEIESAIGNTPNAYVTPKRCWVKDISYNITNCKAL